MKAPDFWWGRPPGILARILSPLGMVWGAVTLRRMRRAGRHAAVPVICVGNFTAGGAGKTPCAIALAEALIGEGHRPVFLTRGYGGRLGAEPVLVDTASHDATEVGDEALLLARAAQTIVAQDRIAGAVRAVEAGASVIVMDDGMQNPSLAKTMTLAVVDGGRGFGNGLCLPAGPLRAPVLAQALQVDAIVAVGIGPGLGEAATLAASAGKPLYRATLDVEPAVSDQLAGLRVLAFSGIGDPAKFFRTLADHYAKVEIARAFADHHLFTEAEAEAFLAEADQRGLRLVTTEKDAVRLRGGRALDLLASRTLIIPVRLALPRNLIAGTIGRLPSALGRA